VATDWESALRRRSRPSAGAGRAGCAWRLSQIFERILIAGAGHTGGRRIEAAQALGIGRNTITRKIAELGIEGGKEHCGGVKSAAWHCLIPFS
jgi:two-component system nitrogen regulation response regulator GlnG